MVSRETTVRKLDIENSIGMIIRTASKSLEKALGEKLKKELSLSGSKWKVLAALSIQDGISQTHLAELIFVEGPTLVSMIDKLEQMELVKRKPDPEDRRNNLIYMTKKSENMINVIVECILEFRKKITSNISERDLETTKEVLRKMTMDADDYYSHMKKLN
ncbi:MAG: MarR family transcriptional regulator [Nitrosopumilaceae archaeon]|nr:MarR family transcriptional regulator [Nitrosopumilaceae archaeon]